MKVLDENTREYKILDNDFNYHVRHQIKGDCILTRLGFYDNGNNWMELSCHVHELEGENEAYIRSFFNHLSIADAQHYFDIYICMELKIPNKKFKQFPELYDPFLN
jgi:hypothetical protein